jgi:hypothetical protein
VSNAHPPNTKSARGRHIGGQRGKVTRNVGATLRLKPGLGRGGVGHGLDRGECLAGDQEQRALRPHLLQHGIEFVAVHIGHEVEALARRHKGTQRQHRHLRPQVRATDADVDHIGDGRVGTHQFGIRQHRIQRGMHLGQLICYIFRSNITRRSKGWGRIS